MQRTTLAPSLASPGRERTALTISSQRPRTLASPGLPVMIHPALLKPSGEARVIFFRSLSVMVIAGIPVDRAMRYLGGQSDDKAMTAVCHLLADKMQAGHQLSQSMSICSSAFSKLQIRLVQMAERTGVLDRVLGELSRYEEKERGIILKIKSSLTYPGFILVIAALMLLFVPPYLMKGLFAMIEGANVKPPLITIVVMKVTAFLRSPYFYLAFTLMCVTGSFLIPPWLRQESTRQNLARVLIQLPVVGRLYRLLAVSRFSRAFGLQMDCGIPPLTALKLAAETTDNPILEGQIDLALDGLRNGLPVDQSLELTGFFPKLLLKMVQVGEESATLPDMLDRTADIYELELDTALDTFTALLEPMVMLGMGIVVGILVMSTMLPMMQVLQNL